MLMSLNDLILIHYLRLIGLRNICYLIFIGGLWWATGIYEVFFALTSFIHYFR